MKGCVDQIDMLSRRVFEGTYQLIQMKFTNAAQGSVEEAAQNQPQPFSAQQYGQDPVQNAATEDFQDRMERAAMERDRSLEIKMVGTLVHLEAQKHNLLQLIDRMKEQAEQNLQKKDKEIRMLHQQPIDLGEGGMPGEGQAADESQWYE